MNHAKGLHSERCHETTCIDIPVIWGVSLNQVSCGLVQANNEYLTRVFVVEGIFPDLKLGGSSHWGVEQLLEVDGVNDGECGSDMR